MMKEEQLRKEIKAIDEQIQLLTETRCTSLVCRTNEHDVALQMQELVEKRMELYYQLNASSATSKEMSEPEKAKEEIKKLERAQDQDGKQKDLYSPIPENKGSIPGPKSKEEAQRLAL